MSCSHGRLTREIVDSFLAEFTSKEDALRFFQEAGLVDENGELAPPYRPETAPEP